MNPTNSQTADSLAHVHSSPIRCRPGSGWPGSLRIGVAVVALLVAALPGGCREKETGPKTTTITDGRIKKVAANPDGTGKITVTYRHEKTGVELDGEAEVVATTVITVGGQPGKLADLEVGQRVDGEVLVEKTGKITKFTASRITVHQAAKPAATTPPADTAPADAPAGGNESAGD